MAETMMSFLGNEFKSGFLVDVTGFQQDTIGPEHQFLVSAASSEVNIFFNKAGTYPQAASFWFDEQKSEFADSFTSLHNKY
jgi:hypothetical protein